MNRNNEVGNLSQNVPDRGFVTTITLKAVCISYHLFFCILKFNLYG